MESKAFTEPPPRHSNYPEPPPRPWYNQLVRDGTGCALAFFTMTVLNVVFVGACFATPALEAALGSGLRAAALSTVRAAPRPRGAPGDREREAEGQVRFARA